MLSGSRVFPTCQRNLYVLNKSNNIQVRLSGKAPCRQAIPRALHRALAGLLQVLSSPKAAPALYGSVHIVMPRRAYGECRRLNGAMRTTSIDGTVAIAVQCIWAACWQKRVLVSLGTMMPSSETTIVDGTSHPSCRATTTERFPVAMVGGGLGWPRGTWRCEWP